MGKKKEITAAEVELYLLDNLDFFKSRESLVAELEFKDSVAGASSLLEKQVKKLEGDIRGLGGKLNNPGFTNKAPADVVERERGRLAEAEAQLAKITVAIHELRRG